MTSRLDSVVGNRCGVAASIKRVRGGRGLGDALYVRPIVDHLIRSGERVKVLTDYKEVFLGSGASVLPFERVRVDVTAHYVGGKGKIGTTQWEDVCASAKVPSTLPLRIDWPVRNRAMIDGLRAQAGRRPMVLVHGGRRPMNRLDGFGMELLPAKAAFDVVLDELRDCFLVQIGKASQLYPLKTDVDLNGSTSVADVLDLGVSCAAVVAQCSFAVPLAEVFDKPLLAIWGGKISSSRELFVRSTTPQKVLSASTDYFVMDDWDAALLRSASRVFRSFLETPAWALAS